MDKRLLVGVLTIILYIYIITYDYVVFIFTRKGFELRLDDVLILSLICNFADEH